MALDFLKREVCFPASLFIVRIQVLTAVLKYHYNVFFVSHRGDPSLVKLNVAITCGYLLYGELCLF